MNVLFPPSYRARKTFVVACEGTLMYVYTVSPFPYYHYSTVFAVDNLFFLFILVILENNSELNVLTFDCQSMKSEQTLPGCTYLAVK